MFRLNLIAFAILGVASPFMLFSILFWGNGTHTVFLTLGTVFFIADLAYRLYQLSQHGGNTLFSPNYGGFITVLPVWIVGIVCIGIGFYNWV